MNPRPIVIKRHGKAVSTSRNLRGILRYRSQGTFIVSPCSIRVRRCADGGAFLRLRWADGAHVVARWNSYSILRQWIAARRTWADIGVIVDGVYCNQRGTP